MSSLTLAADHFLSIVTRMDYEAALWHAMQRYGIQDRLALKDEIARLEAGRINLALAEAL